MAGRRVVIKEARSLARHEIETVVIDLFEVDAQADLPIELRELVAQLPQ